MFSSAHALWEWVLRHPYHSRNVTPDHGQALFDAWAKHFVGEFRTSGFRGNLVEDAYWASRRHKGG